jgi:uncharacterized protein YndB with AHSA1/START domain
LALTGASNSDAHAPSTAALQVTGDVDIRAAIAMSDWTPVNGSSGEYNFHVTAAGRLEITWYESGTLKALTSNVNPTVSDGGLLAIRVTRSNNGGAGAVSLATFYTKATTATTAAADCADDAGWTQLGAQQLGVIAAAPTATTNDVIVGAQARPPPLRR